MHSACNYVKAGKDTFKCVNIYFDPFVAKVLISYPLKKHYKTKGFLVFSGGIKDENIGQKWFKVM